MAKMAVSYDWDFVRRWCIEEIDLFLKYKVTDGPWQEYRQIEKSRRLEVKKLKASGDTIREAVTWVLDAISEPANYGKYHGEGLTRFKEVLTRALSAQDALKEFDAIDVEIDSRVE